MTTSRRGYFRYVTEGMWHSFLLDVAIAISAIVFVAIVGAIIYALLTGQALDDATTELIVPTQSDDQLPTI